MTIRKRYSANFKAKVAIEALKEEKTAGQIASESGVHTVQISQWKKTARESILEGFKSPMGSKKPKDEASREDLYAQIGKLKVELDWLKKKSAFEY